MARNSSFYLCLLAMIGLAVATIGSPARATHRDPGPVAYLDHALHLLRTKHINRAAADWPAIEATARSRIRDAKTPADTYPAIREVLERLGKKHSVLVEARPKRHAGFASGNSPQPVPALQMPLPRGIIARARVGVVWLPSLNTLGDGGLAAGQRYASELRSLLARLDGEAACGWLVDLRQNGGGNMWPMLNGLDPLLGKAPFGHFVVGASETQRWVRTAEGIAASSDVHPAAEPGFFLKHADAPVAVLIGPQTASSGEMLVIALLGRSDVRTFGAPTAGLSTANETYPLGDGAMLAITTMTVRDRLGRDYRGPIRPDQRTEGDTTEIAAVEWLEASCHSNV